MQHYSVDNLKLNNVNYNHSLHYGVLKWMREMLGNE